MYTHLNKKRQYIYIYIYIHIHIYIYIYIEPRRRQARIPEGLSKGFSLFSGMFKRIVTFPQWIFAGKVQWTFRGIFRWKLPFACSGV